jgi:hypothetical protein
MDVRGNGEERRLLLGALEQDAHCTEAWRMLSNVDREAGRLDPALKLCRTGTLAFEKGNPGVKEAKKDLEWGRLENRPSYLRSPWTEMVILKEIPAPGAAAAVERGKTLVSDNQGVRQLIVPWVMMAGGFDAAEEVLNKHIAETCCTRVLFDHALLKFHQRYQGILSAVALETETALCCDGSSAGSTIGHARSLSS